MTSPIVQAEKRRRGVFGRICKWAFILFNIGVAWLLISGVYQVLSDLRLNSIEIGVTLFAVLLSVGVLVFLWLIGASILGALTYLTRGK